MDGTTYTVVRLEAEHGGPLSFALDRELASDFELTLDGSSFLKRAADRGRALSDMSHIYQWDDSGLSWSENDVISVVLDANETSHPRVGETLRADTSGIADLNGLPDEFSYRWLRGERDDGFVTIPGAVGDTYTLTPEAGVLRIRFAVTFTDDDGFPESLESPPTVVVDDPAKGAPVIDGLLNVGETLTVDTSAITDRNGLPAAFTYQWYRLDGEARTAIGGATGSTYTLVPEDRGHRIMVRVTFTDGDGFLEEIDSAPTMGVELINQPATGKPAVTVIGDLEPESTLTADISGIADLNGLPDVFSYQWFRGEGSDFSPIPDAMESTYKLAPEDGALQIRVRVTFTDDAGFLEEGLEPSDPTPVVNAPFMGQPVIIIEELRVGGKLRADTTGITDRNGLPDSFFYYWFRSDGTPIPGAGVSVISLKQAEVGHRIKVEVSFTDQDGFTERPISEFTPRVGAINHAADGQAHHLGRPGNGCEVDGGHHGHPGPERSPRNLRLPVVPQRRDRGHTH